MISNNDWVVMLVTEHFLTSETLSIKEYNDIVETAEDKIKFKEGLKWHHTKQKKGKRSI